MLAICILIFTIMVMMMTIITFMAIIIMIKTLMTTTVNIVIAMIISIYGLMACCGKGFGVLVTSGQYRFAVI